MLTWRFCCGLLCATRGPQKVIASSYLRLYNPNVVVNGDADKILALASIPVDPNSGNEETRIVIDTDGAIETATVKSAITHIMEGGEKAFDLRRRKYRFGTDAY